MNITFKIRLKIQNCFYKKQAILLFLFLFGNTLTFAQTDIEVNKPNLSKRANKDSIVNIIDTNSKIIKAIKLAKSDLKTEVKYKAQDSIIYDADTKTFLLYKKGNIIYDDLELNSDAIIYNVDSSTLSASMTDTVVTDSTEKPLFKQADQQFTFSNLAYNFKSQRAIVEGAKTQYNDGFIISNQIKRNQDKSIFGLRNIYTTCSLDTPHFGIYAKKIKVIPNLVGISGPAQLVIENIPTPLVLPFGIFPLKKGEHAGFILPKYNFELRRGFGLTNFGYYIPINDYMNLRLTGDIFSFGSYRVNATSNYIKRYKYNGGINIGYSKNIIERNEDVFYDQSNSFNISWNHSIDPKLLRGASFSANVNIASSNNNQFNFNNNIDRYLNNTLSSSISYSKNWKGKPYNFSIVAGHDQNNTTRLFTLRLPTITFGASGLTPFVRKNMIGKPKWYEKISFTYNATAINTLSFYDTAFTASTISVRNMNNGIEQRVNSGYNTTILKYLNWNINASYNEYWYSKKLFQFYNIGRASLDTILNNGFYAARNYSFGTGLTTNIFGLKTFKKGWLRGIRHHLTPKVDLNYTPDFGSPFYNFYYETFLDKNFGKRQVFYYDGAPIGRPAVGKSGSIGLGLGNTLQVKIKNNKDTTNGGITKVAVFDNFDFRTSYNLLADSNNWAPITFGYSANIANVLRITGGGELDMYAADTSINQVYRAKYYQYTINNNPLRFNGANLRFSKDFTSDNKTKKNNTDTTKKAALSDYLHNDITWSVSLNANFSVTNRYIKRSRKDTVEWNGDFNFSGNIGLTENWKVTFSSGYRIVTKEIVASSIGIQRNLHCWEMSFNIIPFGFARGYEFSLRPKSSLLKDLNVRRQRNFNDNF
jgi:LptD protein